MPAQPNLYRRKKKKEHEDFIMPLLLWVNDGECQPTKALMA